MFLSSRSVIVAVVATLVLLVTTPATSFVVSSNRAATTTTSLNLFGDALKGAFANDENLGKAKNAGLTGGPKYNENVSFNGKPCQRAVVGQKVSVVAASARVKIPYNCKAGDCGTCMIKMNGRKVKACQMTIPAGKCVMETL